MRRTGTTNLPGWISRLAVMIAAAVLLLAPAVHATDMRQLTGKLPRAFIGEFQWEGDKTVQNVVITFDKVRALNGRNAEALGCGSYEAGHRVTRIKVQMFVRLSDLTVEILELSPEGNSTFETGGSHRGTLSNDLQRIDAEWTTTTSGQRGRLHLRAASSAACEPAASL